MAPYREVASADRVRFVFHLRRSSSFYPSAVVFLGVTVWAGSMLLMVWSRGGGRRSRCVPQSRRSSWPGSPSPSVPNDRSGSCGGEAVWRSHPCSRDDARAFASRVHELVFETPMPDDVDDGGGEAPQSPRHRGEWDE